ncbi:glutathione S-transferase U17-like [Senna tora]|uniref:Glutathione S-transferase U17-like n=1 Tax=Senna tora TaxID=362788 RepID=A0A834SRJ0_9FABA|nr:glutathione S-transferase U17-like [Senna tora]KAF7809213.1 glutathione S-transferase U17-like [Senna tora]
MANNDLKLLGAWFSPFANRWSLSLENILLSCDDNEAKKTYFEEVEEELVIMEDALEKCSKGKPFFGGDHIGLVDIIFGTSLRWLSAIEIMNGRKVLVESKTPALVKWAQRFVSDPNVKSVLPETEKLIEYGKAIQIRRKAAAAANIVRGTEDDEAMKTYFEELEEGLVIMEDVLEKCSKGKPFFGGDHIGLVDITLGSFLRWLSVIEIMNGRKVLVEAKTPALVKWAERFASDPNVKGVLPETEKLIEYAKAIQIKRKAAAAAAAK